jgi:hypothetical protein
VTHQQAGRRCLLARARSKSSRVIPPTPRRTAAHTTQNSLAQHSTQHAGPCSAGRGEEVVDGEKVTQHWYGVGGSSGTQGGSSSVVGLLASPEPGGSTSALMPMWMERNEGAFLYRVRKRRSAGSRHSSRHSSALQAVHVNPVQHLQHLQSSSPTAPENHCHGKQHG